MAKKVLSIALALLMIFNVFAVAVSAADGDQATITLATDKGNYAPGETFDVTVSLKTTYKVFALQMMIAYDSTCYEVVSATGSIPSGAKFTSVTDSATLVSAAKEDNISLDANLGLLRIGYAWLPSAGATNPVAFDNDTPIATLKFRVKANATVGNKGVIEVAPQFVVPDTTPSFDTRLATYVGKGTTTIADSVENGQLYGNTIVTDKVELTIASAECAHTPGAAKEEGRVEPTATTPGYYYSVVRCTKCNEIISSTKVDIPATGHKTGETKETITKQPTCTEKGSKEIVVYCSCCTPAAVISRTTAEIPAKGHTEKVLPAVAPTCTATGLTEGKICTVCNTPLVAQTTVKALGHDLKSVVTPPSCTEEGYTTYSCSRCDYSYVGDKVPVSGHSYTVVVSETPATCTEAGSKTLKCSGCDATKTEEIKALGHDDGKWSTVTEPDCTNKGLDELKCTRCDELLETRDVDALGHKEGEVKEENRKEPDCVNAGSYEAVVYCTVCTEELSREEKEIPALGHTGGEVKEENRKEPTAEEDGSYEAVVYCTVCGAEVSRETVILSSFNKAAANITTIISKNKVKADDIVTVTVKLSTNFNVANIQIPVLFDKTQFEVVGTTSNKNYLTFGDMFTTRNYAFGGRADQQKALDFTSNPEVWNTEEARAQYGVAFLTVSQNPGVGNDDTTFAKPQGDIVATFQLKALKDVEDTSDSVFVSEEFAKTESNKKGYLTVGMVAVENYEDFDENEHNIFYGYVTYTAETIAIAGVTVTGTVTSFDDKIDNSDDVTITFTAEGSDAVYTATATGSGDQTYELTEVVAGTYTVTVSKANHVTRTYTVEVGDADVTQDLVIHLLGDINGDGKANTIDVARANSHAKKTTTLTGYAFDCANVSGDDKVNTVDVARINMNAKGTSSLWK